MNSRLAWSCSVRILEEVREVREVREGGKEGEREREEGGKEGKRERGKEGGREGGRREGGREGGEAMVVRSCNEEEDMDSQRELLVEDGILLLRDFGLLFSLLVWVRQQVKLGGEGRGGEGRRGEGRGVC